MNARELGLLAFAILIGCTEPVIPPSKTSADPIGQRDGQPSSSQANTKPVADNANGVADDALDAGEEKPPTEDAVRNRAPAAGMPVVDAGMDAAADATDPPDATPARDDTTGPAAAVPEIIGTWFGEITGRTLNRVFTGCVVISQVDSPGPAGTSRYVGDTSCRTNLEYVESSGGVYTFNETMTGGSGCPRGYLHLTINPDHTMRYEWFVGNGTMSESLGTLSRADRCPEP